MLLLNKVLTSLLLLSCLYVVYPYRHIQKEFRPYYSNYKTLLSVYCPNQYKTGGESIEFGTRHRNNDEIAYCAIFPFKWKIFVDVDYWKLASPEKKLTIIRHELSHCMLGVDHSLDKNNFMYAYLPTLTFIEIENQTVELLKKTCKRK